MQKNSNLKNPAISVILPNFALIFRGEGVESEKKNGPYQSERTVRVIQIWNQIFKMSDIGV